MYKYKNKLTVKKGMRRYVARRSRIIRNNIDVDGGMIKCEVYDQITIRRVLLKDTLAKFSERTGISRDVICRLEDLAHGEESRSKSSPSISTLVKLCSSIGVTMSELSEQDMQGSEEIKNRIRNKFNLTIPEK